MSSFLDSLPDRLTHSQASAGNAAHVGVRESVGGPDSPPAPRYRPGSIGEWVAKHKGLIPDPELDAQRSRERVQREAEEAARLEREQRSRLAQDERRAAVRLRIEQHRLELTRRRTDTLDQQIARWWAAQPPDRRNRGYGFEEIRRALQGLTPGAHAANPALSAALRAAGWRRTRVRDAHGEAWAAWWPPTALPDAPKACQV